MKVLVTGVAGFIGFHVARRLLEQNNEVLGLDNINHYYSVGLKLERLLELGIDASSLDYGLVVKSNKWEHLKFVKLNLEDKTCLPKLFEKNKFDVVINLAAQAGVRYSIENPFAYIDSNLVGFANVLECCRNYNIGHLIFASSSSVYGGNTKVPFSEDDNVNNPVSLYAATKKANELMASCYSKLYGFATTGLRFFTVYGPWGRPDMAPMLFAKAITNGEPIKVFNGGDMLRDFTYIDDIVEGVCLVANNQQQLQVVGGKHSIYNIGCSNPIKLTDFISIMEDALGQPAKKIMLPMQPGDVYQTYADTTALERDFGYHPQTTLKEGIARFVEWFTEYKDKLGLV